MEHVIHTIKPVFDNQSEILILGSFPSVKSREVNFYYGHPRNRFWKTLASVFNKPVPSTVEEKKDFLLENRIAVWDVIESCDIKGSSDSSITNVKANDLSEILKNSCVKKIFVNGDKAYRLYNRYQYENTGIEAVKLPSTSPANAQLSSGVLVEIWRDAIMGEDGRNSDKDI